MNQNILKYLRDYSFDTWDVNRLLVSSFLEVNKIKVVNNKFIKRFVITDKEPDELKQLVDFSKLFDVGTFNIEELIEFFEFVISPLDKEINGAVFTPEYIRKYIVKNTIKRQSKYGIPLSNLKFGDISCGCGGFFKTIAETLKKATGKSYFDIFNDNIFGLDIKEYSIIRTKILLSLLAIINNEDEFEFNFNLFCGNALSFNWNTIKEIESNNGFDIIVGNPPYVGSVKMDKETRELLKNWSVSNSGKSDLYIPFFEIGLENLNDKGFLGFITVNTFYKSLNGRSVRKYFSENRFDLTIIDFGGAQLFKNRSTYTCICTIGKQKNKIIKYLKSTGDNINVIKSTDFVSIPYSDLDDFKGWYLVKNKISTLISKIENTGIALGDKFIIRNGFATLKNDSYVFTPFKESKDFYFFIKNDIEVKIEKEICREVIKPNTLKSEIELKDKIERLIFPYNIESKEIDLFGLTNRKLKIINELKFQKKYPLAYNYLLTQKEILSKRDKGNRDYEEWYAFGRNQALTLEGNKLLFPYITDKPCFVLTEKSDLLFYNGYALFSDSIEELQVLQKILMSNIFWFYIKNTSKPYSGNFYSVAKNYIKNFGVCELSAKEKMLLLNLNNQNDIDSFLMNKYELKSHDLQ